MPLALLRARDRLGSYALPLGLALAALAALLIGGGVAWQPEWHEGPLLRGHTGQVLAVAFAPRGALLASAGEDATIRLWDVRTGRERAVLRGHSRVVTRLAFAPGGTVLASGGADTTVRLWDAGTGRITAPLRMAPVRTADEELPVPVGRSEVRESRLRATLEGHRAEVTGLAFAPDGRALASAAADGVVKVWDPDTGAERASFLADAGGVTGLAFAPDCQALATAGADGTVKLWDPATGRERRTCAGHHGAVAAIVFAFDGRLATGGADGMVRLWDPATGAELLALGPQGGAVAAVAFTPDGRVLAAGGQDGSLRVWDTRTSGRPAVLQAARGDWAIHDLGFAADGRTLAAAGGSPDSTVRLWQRGTEARSQSL